MPLNRNLTSTEKKIVNAIYELYKEGKPTANPDISRKAGVTPDSLSTHKTNLFNAFEIPPNENATLRMADLVDAIKNLKANEAYVPPPPEVTKEAKEQPNLPKIPIWVWVGVGILAVILLFSFVMQRKTAVITPTATIRPLDTNQPILPTSTAPQTTFTPVPPTFTLLPPTFTPVSPTFTPLPTETFTPAPTATPEEVVFLDHSFTNGIDPKLTVEGPWTIKDGALTSIDNTPIVITFGDSNWKNYEVELSFRRFNTDGCDFYLGVRKVDRSMLAVKFVRPGRLGWWTFNNGKWAQVAGDEHLIPFAPLTIKVIVQDMTYDWQDYSKITLPGYEAGSVEIHFPYCATMDTIKVVQLP